MFFCIVSCLLTLLVASVFAGSNEYAGPCKCGYSVNSTSDPRYAVFTEALETDFTHIYDLSDNVCWKPQTYNVPASASRGSFGKMATPKNVVPNPFRNVDQWSGLTAKNDGIIPGLQLWVNSTSINGLIPMAEIVARDSDMIYGSFRVGMKITKVPGTCSAFFWYRSNSEEIDMEFLSSSFNDTSRPVYLVMQTPLSVRDGYNAAGTDTYDVHQLPFEPSDGLHEYRFDWTPDGVSFYGDGAWLTDMRWTYPDRPGHLSLNHWSNGNPLWSGGPPIQNAVTTVVYVKAYYNTSDATKQSQYVEKCPDGAANSICQIQDQPFPPGLGNNNANLFFSGGKSCGEGIQAQATSTPILISTTQSQIGTKSVPATRHTEPAGSNSSNAGTSLDRRRLRWTDLIALLLPLV